MYFTFTELSATNIATWNCYVYDSAKGRYEIILGRYILSALGSNIKFSDHVIEKDDGPLKGRRHPWLIGVRMNLKF